MHSTFTKTKAFQIFFLLVLLLPLNLMAQNPTVSLSGGPCTGSTLTVTSSATPTQVVFLLNGSPVATSTSLTYLANAAGTYTATVTTATGSATTNSDVITALTTPSIVISAIPGSTSICAGTNINFNATITTGGSAPTYQWKKNNNPIASSNNSNYSTNAIANGDVISCTLTSNAACASPTSASSNNITYSVVTPVTPSVSITSLTGTTACSGTATTFVATGVNAGSTPSYQWYVNSILRATTNVDTFTTTGLNNHDTVVCKMVTNVPCATVETAVSNGVVMTISTSVVPTISIVASPGTTICSGTTVTFTASGANGGTSIQYQWYQNGVLIPGATGVTYQSSALANNDSIRCTMTSNAACATSALVSSNEVTMTVNATGTPTIAIAPNNGTSVCVNDTVAFSATTTFGGAAPIHTWYKNSTVLPGLSASTISLTGLANNDTISCVLTSNQVCATTNTATSNSVVMTVSPHVTITLTITANPGNSITAGDLVVFTATVANAGPSYSYQWYVNGVAKAGSISPTYSTNSLANNDTVTCKVTTTEPCVASPVVTSNAIVMNVASGVAIVGKGTLSVGLYPNPNGGNFSIRGAINGDTKEADVVVMDLIGRVIYNAKVAVQNGTFDHALSLPVNTANGFYLLKLQTENASDVLKFGVNK